MNSDQKRAFLAVVLSGIILFGWQKFFAPKIAPKRVVETQQQMQVKESPIVGQAIHEKSPTGTALESSSNATEFNKKLVSLKNKETLLEISNDFDIQDYKAHTNVFPFREIFGQDNRFQIFIKRNNKYTPFYFDEIIEQSSRELKAKSSKYNIQVNISLDENGKSNFKFTSAHPEQYRFSFTSKEDSLENRQVKDFLVYGKEIIRSTIGSSDEGDGRYKWAALDYNFHLFTLLFNDRKVARFNSMESGLVNFDLVEASSDLNFSLLFVKKNYDYLHSFGEKFELAVDFGWFGIIAVPILRGLQFIYEYIPNYGLAILLLTFFIRLLTFPLQFKSFKSMKKMQKIQPELTKLKEKFKDDPQRMQKETMDLFKRTGANPLSGCLPMVLQFPILIAFYNVLYNAVELVNAPFYFWITDLSIKDPFYVLPILMGIAMFFQNKLNPSASADPSQQKVMMFMPLIFCFIMKDLPAGLNLYFFFSTLLGIIQQMIVYKTTD